MPTVSSVLTATAAAAGARPPARRGRYLPQVARLPTETRGCQPRQPRASEPRRTTFARYNNNLPGHAATYMYTIHGMKCPNNLKNFVVRVMQHSGVVGFSLVRAAKACHSGECE